MQIGPCPVLLSNRERLETKQFFNLIHRSVLLSRFSHKYSKKLTDQVVHGCISIQRDLPGSTEQLFVDS